MSDSSLVKKDSIQKPKQKKNPLTAKVEYTCNDSLIFSLKDKKAFLYQTAEIKYEKIILKSDIVEFDFDKSEVAANGKKDSLGNLSGNPVFNEGDKSFKSKFIRYNFNSKKGLIKEVITKEGEGYMHGQVIKRLPNEEVNVAHGKYTTCELDHPHFDVRFIKAKVIPDKKIVTGPAILTVADVPTPLMVPFGYFPIKKGRRAGIIFPAFGETAANGFFIGEGGFYFGYKDYIDFAIKGKIYTKGDLNLIGETRYKKRYKFDGSSRLSYTRNIDSEKGLPDYNKTNIYLFEWRHNQDTKAHPNRRFSADVKAGSSKFYKNTPLSLNNYLTNSFNSNILFEQNINQKYFFGASIRHTQNTQTSIIDLTLPNLSFATTTIYPFRKENNGGKIKWYENINLGYRTNIDNKINTTDSTIFTSETIKNMNNGMKHDIPINSTIKLLKFFSLSNNVNFTERWYLKHYSKNWIDTNSKGDGYVRTDTVNKFSTVHEYSFSSNLSTTLYGMVQLKKGPLKAIRHTIRPTIGFYYQPDFSKPMWGYYGTVENREGKIEKYSYYERNIYSGPSQGLKQQINFGVDNKLEIKIKSKKDTIKGTKIITLIESFSINGNYNFAADSCKLSDISVSGRTRLLENIDISYSTILRPYISDSNYSNRINKLEWDVNKKLYRIDAEQWNININWHLGPKTTNQPKTSTKGSQEELDEINKNLHQYIDYNVPWNLNLSYGINYGINYRAKTNQNQKKYTIIQTASASGDISLTKKWKISGNFYFDLDKNKLAGMQININRDLHCWDMSLSWTPIGYTKSYLFTIKAKSSLLQDLKLEKRRDFRDY